jgi:hypothetical protein
MKNFFFWAFIVLGILNVMMDDNTEKKGFLEISSDAEVIWLFEANGISSLIDGSDIYNADLTRGVDTAMAITLELTN